MDGTYIPVRVPREDRGRYRNRKGDVSVNVLAVCDKNMNFIYVLTGWEGSAADGRVLRDAVTRPQFNLNIPNGRSQLIPVHPLFFYNSHVQYVWFPIVSHPFVIFQVNTIWWMVGTLTEMVSWHHIEVSDTIFKSTGKVQWPPKTTKSTST